MLLDNQGNVVNEITYDAFGNITVETNPDVNFRFSYTGRELDAETGLYNYRSRYYDPAVGEFVSEDRIGFASGDSNLSRYVTNNPVNYVDPTGNDDMRTIPGSVVNLSDSDAYIINSKKNQDQFEVLHSGAATPDTLGYSKDADGVWVKNKNNWNFYPVSPLSGTVVIDQNNNAFLYKEKIYIPPSGDIINPKPIVSSELIPIKPWNRDPNDQNSPGKRSAPDNLYPPDTRLTYPDASKSQPVAKEDTGGKTFREWLDSQFQNGPERLLDFLNNSQNLEKLNKERQEEKIERIKKELEIRSRKQSQEAISKNKLFC
jgi:RHS repeat-associated protein